MEKRGAFVDNSVELTVSLSALARNGAAVVKEVGVPVIGVVKCRGYGLGLETAARAWVTAGAAMLAVSRPEEALALREAGFSQEILLLSPVAEEELLAALVTREIILTVSDLEGAHFCQRAGAQPVRVHAAVDTGMGRFGVPWEDLEQVARIYDLAGLEILGIYSHFSNSFEAGFRETRRQLDRFRRVTEGLQARGIAPGMRHMANSCAALRFPETRLDAVRIGSALLGRLPVAVPVDLEPVGQVRAWVVQVRTFRKGDTAGYGGYYRFPRDTRAAVVALGRQEGFGRIAAPERLRLRDALAYLRCILGMYRQVPAVIWRGRTLPLVGRVGTQFTLFDAGKLDIRPGDWVCRQTSPLGLDCPRRIMP